MDYTINKIYNSKASVFAEAIKITGVEPLLLEKPKNEYVWLSRWGLECTNSNYNENKLKEDQVIQSWFSSNRNEERIKKETLEVIQVTIYETSKGFYLSGYSYYEGPKDLDICTYCGYQNQNILNNENYRDGYRCGYCGGC